MAVPVMYRDRQRKRVRMEQQADELLGEVHAMKKVKLNKGTCPPSLLPTLVDT